MGDDQDEINENSVQSLFGELHEWSNNTLGNVRSLRISDNFTFTSDNLFMICENMNLHQLFLCNLPNLIEIPPRVMKLEFLKVFSLIQCPLISVLPLSIKFLKNLEILHVDCPQISHLPIFIALIPTLNLLFFRRSYPLCSQCKDYPKNHIRILVPSNFTLSENPDSEELFNPEPLSVLAAASYLSTFYIMDSVYSPFHFKTLLPYLEFVVSSNVKRCDICYNIYPNMQMIGINFTRLKNCKCMHLQGHLCSPKCRDILVKTLKYLYPNCFIVSSVELLTLDTLIQREGHAINRIRRWLTVLFSCVPLYKKSYTITPD